MLLMASTLLFGCDDRDATGLTTESAATGASRPTLLARVDGDPIDDVTVDGPLRLGIYDLRMAQFRLRQQRLDELISERLGPGVPQGSDTWNERVESFLVAPSPPRLQIPLGSTPPYGAPDAPVVVVVFIDFESSHNRRLQPHIVKLIERFPGRVQLTLRDLPLPYHRNAFRAAIAARCANEQERYFAYHDVLLIEQPDFRNTALVEYAGRVGIDSRAFEVCLYAQQPSALIKADLALAAKLGIRRAATIFVNGLYIAGRPEYAELEERVVAELRRLGLDSRPDVQTAALSPSAEDAADAALPAIPPGTLAEPELIVALDRGIVDQALQDRSKLNGQLDASRGEFSGQRLLKIRKIAPGDLFDQLGLEEGDVFLAVNGAFVTVDHESIFDSFATGDEVTILIMRRGKPHTYGFRIR
jgi:protein-disulfide isomerase